MGGGFTHQAPVFSEEDLVASPGTVISGHQKILDISRKNDVFGLDSKNLIPNEQSQKFLDQLWVVSGLLVKLTHSHSKNWLRQ